MCIISHFCSTYPSINIQVPVQEKGHHLKGYISLIRTRTSETLSQHNTKRVSIGLVHHRLKRYGSGLQPLIVFKITYLHIRHVRNNGPANSYSFSTVAFVNDSEKKDRMKKEQNNRFVSVVERQSKKCMGYFYLCFYSPAVAKCGDFEICYFADKS